jgi:hypothetical protein
LKIANYQCQNLAISGFSFTGSDIGGFVEILMENYFADGCNWLYFTHFSELIPRKTLMHKNHGLLEKMDRYRPDLLLSGDINFGIYILCFQRTY